MNSRRRAGNTLAVAGIMVAGWLLAAEAIAGQLVTFKRGNSLVVQSSEKRGVWYYLTLEGGGQIGVLSSLVMKIEEYEAPPPPAAPTYQPQPGGNPGSPALSTRPQLPGVALPTPAAGPGPAGGTPPDPDQAGLAPDPTPAATDSEADPEAWRSRARERGAVEMAPRRFEVRKGPGNKVLPGGAGRRQPPNNERTPSR